VPRPVDIDIDFTVGLYAATEKEVESKDCKQDNDDDGNRSNTTGRIFRHILPPFRIDAPVWIKSPDPFSRGAAVPHPEK